MTIYDVCIFIGFLIEAVIAVQYFDTLFSNRYSKSITRVCVFIGYVILYLAFNSSMFILNAIAFVIINGLICYLLYDSGVKETVFHTTLMTTLLFVSEIFIVVICMQLIGSLPNNLSSVVASITVLSNKIVYFIALQLLLVIFERKKDNRQAQTSVVWNLTIIPISTIIFFFIMLYILVSVEVSIEVQLLILACCVLLAICNLFVYNTYRKNQRLNEQYLETTLKLEKELSDHEYYQMLHDQKESQHILIHDIKNHFEILKAYSNANKFDKIKEYLLQIDKSSNLNIDTDISDNETLNLVIYRYRKLCETANIIFDAMIVPESINFMLDSDITALFGNLLQNSYEAAQNLPDSLINLIVVYDTKRNTTDIRLINSYDPLKIIINNKSLLSNKKNNIVHGYGIKSIKKIVKDYGGIYNFHEDKKECIFSSFVSIPKK